MGGVLMEKNIKFINPNIGKNVDKYLLKIIAEAVLSKIVKDNSSLVATKYLSV